ncbi:hypothetical protein OAF27_03225 [Verrucomicrobiales bacterium]|nr:hypothetical protein [Verrucomicrobiales bacterium]
MSCGKKRLLFIRATTDYPDAVIEHIQSVCSLLDIEVVVHEYKGLDTFEPFLEDNKDFDFIYVAAHGAHHCFGENSGGPIARWADFALVLCRTEALNSNAVIFMGCCHGGLKKVSLILFSLCEQISCVCGPRWTVNLREVPVALHVFLHNLMTNSIEPQLAAERTADSLGMSFPFYNRYELETEIMIAVNLGKGYNDDYCTTEELEPYYPPEPAPEEPPNDEPG